MEGFTTEELKIKQMLFLRNKEFSPLLTSEQYKVYVKHIEFVIKGLHKKQRR